VLLAVMASMYAVYHGPDGLRKIAERIRLLTATLARGLERIGYDVSRNSFLIRSAASTLVPATAKISSALPNHCTSISVCSMRRPSA
jgi:glycine cleavage system pyridoxal-binding protein P